MVSVPDYLLQEMGWRQNSLDAKAVTEEAECALNKLLVRLALQLNVSIGARVLYLSQPIRATIGIEEEGVASGIFDESDGT